MAGGDPNGPKRLKTAIYQIDEALAICEDDVCDDLNIARAVLTKALRKAERHAK